MQLSLPTVNKILSISALVVAAYFLLTLVFGAAKLLGVSQHIRGLEAKSEKSQNAAVQPYAPPASADPALNNRNIFQPAGASSASSVDAPASSSGIGAYRLVGISMSKNPADTYVMVENTQTRLTYFLQYNQPVEGLELEKILEDKVIVKIGGKSVEFE